MNSSIPVGLRGGIFKLDYLSREWNEVTPKVRKRWIQSGKKREKRYRSGLWSMHFFSFSRASSTSVIPLFPSQPLVVTSSLSRWFPFVSLRLSHRISGWWPMVVVVVSGWWWLWWGGSWFLRAYTAPYLSFLSLWEGEEGPRSRALRTEFIIDRAISLTAPRRS